MRSPKMVHSKGNPPYALSAWLSPWTAALPCRIFVEIKEEASLGRALVKALPCTQNAEQLSVARLRRSSHAALFGLDRPKQATCTP